MTALKKLTGTKATSVTIDEEIELLERLVMDDKVEHMIQIIELKGNPAKVHVSPMSCPLGHVRDLLKTALEAVEDVIGK